jgi:4-hydroxy-tetrahydrodipicolinate reductase
VYLEVPDVMMGSDAKRVLRIGVLGSGRMGREVIRAAAADDGLKLAGVWTRQERQLTDKDAGTRESMSSALVGGDLDAVLAAADAAIDFTLPGATPQILDAAVKSGTPLVCGVSGLDHDVLQSMQRAAASVPVFYDRNMSFGIAALTELVRRAGAILGPDFAAAIHETHHAHKIDAPSGTALKLGEALADVRSADFASVYRYSRDGSVRRASPDDILFSVTRKGENPGEHTVTFQSEAETLELTHKVQHRRVFALGALEAARWLVRQKPGLYAMADLIDRP